MRYRTDYHAALLGEEPNTLELGSWQLHYLAFSTQAHDLREPVLLLGGAFQSFRSFAAELEELLAHHPVILLDLPGQGNNLQDAGELSLEGLADLIAQFSEAFDLPPLMPIGLSYGSTLAALFACRHPKRCARLLLSGITAFGRPGSRRLLEEGLTLLAEGEQSAFAEAAINNLINPLELASTEVPLSFRKALLRQMQRLSPAEVRRYRHNSQRLLDFSGFRQHPQCPTLVLAGEHDHFTQAWEQALFAQSCPQGEFALISGADHLAQYERRHYCGALYRPFLRGEAISAQPGSRLIERSQLDQLERRCEPRRSALNNSATLSHPRCGQIKVSLSELGFFGGLIQCSWPSDWPRRGWQLQIGELPALAILPLRSDQHGLAFVTLHRDATARQALLTQLSAEQLAASACA